MRSPQKAVPTINAIVPLLRERGKRGLVRRIHGDLHLGNIALIDGRPVLFDAIEFSDVIGSGDVLYDLAFLLMDLSSASCRKRPISCSTATLPKRAGTKTWMRWRRCRSFCRCGLRSAPRSRRRGWSAPKPPSATRSPRRRAPISTLRSVRSILRRPQCIAVGGLSGTGKTRLARALAAHIAPMPGAVIVRSDVERKMLFGAGETDKLPAAAYAPDVTARVYGSIADKARRIVAAGHSAIVDAVFATAQERDALAAAARAAKVPVQGLFLTADLATRIARVGGRTKDASDADAAVAEAQENYRAGRADLAENRRFRHACGNFGAAPGLRFRRTRDRDVIARLTRPRRYRHKRPDAPPSGPGAAIKDFPIKEKLP